MDASARIESNAAGTASDQEGNDSAEDDENGEYCAMLA